MVPHKYTTPETIAGIKNKIAGLDSEIARRRSISRKDPEGIAILVDFLKKLVESARRKKDMALDGLMEDGKVLIESRVQERMSLLFRGQEQALIDVLDMLENPDVAVDIFDEERKNLKDQLEYYAQLEQRDLQADTTR